MNILLASATGRLGKSILEAAVLSPLVHSVFAWVREPSNLTCSSSKVTCGVNPNQEFLSQKDLVFVEAGTSDALESHLKEIQSFSIPSLIASTALKEGQTQQLKELSLRMPLLLAPNLSLGVAALQQILKDLPKVLKDAHVEMLDIHHEFKKDAPSGTAISLSQSLGKEIPIHSLRGGDVIGEHQLSFFLRQEKITLTHEALSREVFAVGALKAARFLMKAKPGMYTMADVLKGNE